MSADVVDLNVVTKLDLPPERILRKAAAADLESAIVMGWNKSGDFFFAGSFADGAETLWLLELAKRRLFEAADALDDAK